MIWGYPGKMIIHLVSLGLSWTISSSCFSNLEKHGYSSLHPSFHRTEHTSVLMEIIWTYQEFPWASPSTLTLPEPMPQTGTWEPKMAHIHVGWGGVGWDVDGICTWPGMARFGHVVNKSLFGVTIAIPRCRQISANACCKPFSTIAKNSTWPPSSLKLHKASQGITRHHKASQGITRHHKASQGITRHHKASQGITRPQNVTEN